jgi:predicted MFS family arabinose efflux permease
VAAVFGGLTIEQLYVVELLVGVGTVVFDVFHGAYVPGLVGRANLVEANSRLELNRTLGFTAGPAIGGQVVAWFGPALAPLASAAGLLWSAGWIASVRAPEPPPPATAGRSVRADIREGLRFVLQEPFVRATTLYNCAAVACLSTRYAVETLFLLRTVGLDPAWIGLVLTAAGVGTVVGALAAVRLAGRFGELRVVAGSALGMGLSSLLIPLTTPGAGLIVYVLGTGLVGFWIMVNNVVSVGRGQRVCPDDLLGRMTATSRLLSWATLPLGGVLGGLIGTAVGVRTTLWLTAGGLVLSSVWLGRALAGVPSGSPGDNKVPLHA